MRSIQRGREGRHKKGGGESIYRFGTAVAGASLFCVDIFVSSLLCKSGHFQDGLPW